MSDRAPDVLGEIVGWRAWRVIGDRPERLPLLASATYQSTIWHPGYWTPATCGGRLECSGSTDGCVPGESCTCGLYAAKDRKQLVHLGYAAESGYGRSLAGGRFPKVVGEVGLVGKVIPAEQGWRAEKGRVVRLYVPFQHWKLVDALEDLYGVEVLLDNTLKVEPTRLGEER